jgi:hypothetical protein
LGEERSRILGSGQHERRDSVTQLEPQGALSQPSAGRATDLSGSA